MEWLRTSTFWEVTFLGLYVVAMLENIVIALGE